MGASPCGGTLAVGGVDRFVVWHTTHAAAGDTEGDRPAAAGAALSRIERQRLAQAGKRLPDRKATQLRGQWGAGR
jgi:hypothetical protein